MSPCSSSNLSRYTTKSSLKPPSDGSKSPPAKYLSTFAATLGSLAVAAAMRVSTFPPSSSTDVIRLRKRKISFLASLPTTLDGARIDSIRFLKPDIFLGFSIKSVARSA